MGIVGQVNIALDLYSAVLSVVLAVYVLIGRDRRDPVNLCFVGMGLSSALMALGDTQTWYVGPLTQAQYVLTIVGNLVFYLMAAPVFLCFTGYIVAYLRRQSRVRRAVFVPSVALFALYAAGCVASLRTGWFFSVSPEAGYARGPLFALSQAVPLGLHAFNAVLVVRHRRGLSRRELLGFSSYLLLPFVAEIVQIACYGIALMNTSIALALLLVFMNIQAERETLFARRERELAVARADIMLSQVQPHFLYNVLAAIRELCVRDARSASQAITEFSAYLRGNMASLASREPIAFAQEMRHVRTYLSLEGRRFGSRLRTEFDVRAEGFALPALSVQTLVENAVRHGLTRREEGGCVRVSSRDVGAEGFVVEVSDDGVGFDPQAPLPRDGRVHLGLANVRTRLEAACGGTLEVESALGRGTTVRLHIPRCAALAQAADSRATGGMPDGGGDGVRPARAEGPRAGEGHAAGEGDAS